MATILVTGAAGFIGSHLVEKLVGQGNRVIGLDNLYTGSKANLKNVFSNVLFAFIEHDIIEPFVPLEKIDQIYNLACPASPVHYQRDPIKTMKVSTIGVMNMLELARTHKARILQASTSEIYGDPEMHPQTEDYRGNVSSIGPRACYDEGKRAAETLFFDYHRHYGLEIKVARIFNTYGPQMAADDGRVVSNFIVQALKQEPITLYGNGEQTRSFCYVSDLVAGLVALMNSETQITGPVNLGNPAERTVKELAELIIAKTKTTSGLVYHDLPVDDPRRRKPEITLAKQLLGWEPNVSIEEGLQKTIAYFKTKI